MSTHIRPRIIVAALGLAIATGVGVGIGMSGSVPERPVANLDTHSTRIAIQVWNDSLSLLSDTTPVVHVTTPAPSPVRTTAPRQVVVPTGSPCPGTVNVQTTGPDSNVEVHCSRNVSGRSSSSTNISVSSSSHQTSTGGSNSSTNQANITVTNQ